MKRKFRILMAAAFMTVLFSITAFAAGWTRGQGENSNRWWYDLGDGTWYAGTRGNPSWQWLDGNGDGAAECYAFDENGWLYAATQTPDGYQVNEDGAWTENGAVRTRNSGAVAGTGERKILVAYYSRTNSTERAANLIYQQTGGDLFEIQPAEPYPDSYSATRERAQREISGGTLPEMAKDVENFESYDVVFVGYPIWWGQAPKIVWTFMETYDFSGKTIVPFCTSGSSGIGSSASNLHDLCSDTATWLEGARLEGSTSREEMSEWINGLGLEVTAE